ncbi:Actin- protein 2/3 complex subunit 2 [Phytophthora pseudosyringae]|uniref:Arp2/3 complex 34 kDa subunit n=1 Tax=Phytophthora pseudosyringae TaxID=221518 RepID=A0A8T1W027_9STRA|nr:Actin- protein 2/3 complex subunit 2 [Phytophthora pseudosyringae]
MLFLESENKIIKEVLEGRLGENAPRPVQALEIRLCDFDDVQYDMSIVDNLLTVSMAYPPYKTLEGLGAKQMFAVTYPEFQLVAPKTGFDFSLQLEVVVQSKATDMFCCLRFDAADFIERVSVLKRNILGAPFEQCFEALQNGNASTLGAVQIPYRRNETIYVLPQADRIVIVYSVCFEDKTDQAIARVFLQEFVDTRRTVNNAPPVAFGKDPPLELRGAPGLRNSPDLVGYLSLAIFPTHVDTTEKRIKASTLVQGLRNYLHYHIKASKTYLHIRMRKRVDLLLQVLNRARPEKDQSKTQKKTITGRTFARA